MDILASFNSVGIHGRPVLGLIDSQTLAFRIPKLPRELERCVGTSGLAVSGQHVYVIAQAPPLPPRLFVLARADLTVLGCHVFNSATDVHSLWASADSLYVASSGTDEVIAVQLSGAGVLRERVVWRPEPDAPRTDIHHINSVYGWGGKLFVSGFGKRQGPMWRSANAGFIVTVNSGERIATGLRHPHSVLVIDGEVAYCASSERVVQVVGGRRSPDLPGYTRGLCVLGEKLFVGTSRERRVSKSTGRINGQDARGTGPAICSITRLSLPELAIEATVDLGDYATEIFDLRPVDGAEGWPVVSPSRFCALDTAWWLQTERLIEDIASTTRPDDTLILVDQCQLGKNATIGGRRYLPFIEKNGQYWGPPPDDATALRELERLREAGAGFIAFAWPAFWWLDHYTGLHRYLRSRFPCVVENDRLIIFELRS